METALKSDYLNSDAENLLFDLEKKGLRIIARSGQLVVKPKKAKVKKTREVELPSGDIEIQEVEE